MRWIINDIDETDELEKLLKYNGNEVFKIKSSCGVLPEMAIEEFCSGGEPVMFHGSLYNAKYLNYRTNVLTYCNLKLFECSNYYPYYQNNLLNYPYSLISFGDLFNNKMKNKLLALFSVDGKVFIRPNSGGKQFTGCLINILDSNKDFLTTMYQNDLILVSSPNIIGVEWRVWIGDGKVIGSSMYRPLIMEGCPNEVIKFAENMAEIYSPEDLFTMDICQDENSNLKIVEINSFGCSGFYKVDLANMIPKAMEIGQKCFESEKTPF